MKPILILQAFGLGDCIWSQGIAHHFIQKGHHVIWPVKPQFVDGLQRAYPKIIWVSDEAVKSHYFDIKEMVEVDGMIIAPIRWSDSYMKVPYMYVMKSKYDMYGLDWKIWKNHALWRNDHEKQSELLNVLGIKYGEEFVLVNRTFGTDSQLKVDINVQNVRVVEMRNIPSFSLFDWFSVMNIAKEIHTVSTSIIYMLEMIPYAKPIHLYVRKPIEKDFSFVKFMFTKPYILHE